MACSMLLSVWPPKNTREAICGDRSMVLPPAGTVGAEVAFDCVPDMYVFTK